MCRRDEHLAIARRNEAAAQAIATRYPEWAVTMLFYAALHYVEAYWAEMHAVIGSNQHYESHIDRGEAIERFLPHLRPHYRALERRAYDARHRGGTFTQHEFEELRAQRLAPISRSVQEAIRSPR